METEHNPLATRPQKFMQSFDTDNMKRRKEEQEVQLRKTKRTDEAIKRRNMHSERE